MKFLSFAVGALLAVSQLAAAAPTPLPAPAPAPAPIPEAHLVALQARAAPRVPTPQEFINKNLIKAPRTDKAFFWTGAQNQGNLRRLRPVALQVAEKEGFDIVGEMLQPAARKLIFGFNAEVNKLPKAKQAKFVDDFWDNASEAFAELTTGQVTVMMEGDPENGPQPEASSVFARKERPVLEERSSFGNRAVTGVDRIGRDFLTTKKRVPFKV